MTISSCQIRRTTFQIDARMRPVRLRSRALHQSACVLSNICATFAGTVVDHVRVTTRGNGSSAPRPRRLTGRRRHSEKTFFLFEMSRTAKQNNKNKTMPFLRCCTAHTATSAQLAVNGSARGLLPLLASTSCWELCTPHHDHATAASLHCTSAPRPHPNTGRPPGRPIAAVGLPQAS